MCWLLQASTWDKHKSFEQKIIYFKSQRLQELFREVFQMKFDLTVDRLYRTWSSSIVTINRYINRAKSREFELKFDQSRSTVLSTVQNPGSWDSSSIIHDRPPYRNYREVQVRLNDRPRYQTWKIQRIWRQVRSRKIDRLYQLTSQRSDFVPEIKRQRAVTPNIQVRYWSSILTIDRKKGASDTHDRPRRLYLAWQVYILLMLSS